MLDTMTESFRVKEEPEDLESNAEDFSFEVKRGAATGKDFKTEPQSIYLLEPKIEELTSSLEDENGSWDVKEKLVSDANHIRGSPVNWFYEPDSGCNGLDPASTLQKKDSCVRHSLQIHQPSIFGGVAPSSETHFKEPIMTHTKCSTLELSGATSRRQAHSNHVKIEPPFWNATEKVTTVATVLPYEGHSQYCSICKKEFTDENSLNMHVLEHADKRIYTCGICSKIFFRRYNIKRHLASHAKKDYLLQQKQKLQYTCGTCQKTFCRRSHLKRHVSLHSDETPYGCDICTERFKAEYYLKRHIETHTGIRRYVCTICGKKFSLPSNLKRHNWMVHVKEQPFACKECGRVFSSKIGLLGHERTHTGERPFQCNKCLLKFSWRSNLKRHMSKHIQEPPYICPTCDQEFKDRSNLTNHMVVHTTTEKLNTCNICNRSFKRQIYLSKHMATHAPETPEAIEDLHEIKEECASW